VGYAVDGVGAGGHAAVTLKIGDGQGSL